MFEKIYDQAKDLHVRKVVIYGKSENHELYTDPTFSNQLKVEDLKELFTKGMLLLCTDAENGVFEEVVKISGNIAYTINAAESALAFVNWTAADK